MSLNRITFQLISQQKMSWQTLPDDLCEHVLSFLSEKDFAQIKRTNKRMYAFADLATHFNRCRNHPQYLQENSFSDYLITLLTKLPLLEDKQAPKKMQAYFKKQFREYAANLLTDYKTLYNKIFIQQGVRWISDQEIVKHFFYPSIKSPQGLKRRCHALWDIAQEVKSDYHAVFDYLKEAKQTGQMNKILPLNLEIKRYIRLYKFLGGAHFLEVLWSDLSFLQSILRDNIPQVFQSQARNFNQTIVDRFGQSRLTQNLTSVVTFYIKNLLPQFFSTHLLIDVPLLFNHFNRLSKDELIFVMQYTAYYREDRASFLRKLLEKDEIRQRLASCDYVELVRRPGDRLIYLVEDEADIILSLPQVIAELEDGDLLVLVGGFNSDDRLLSLLTRSAEFRRRMNANLWFELVSRSYTKAAFVARNKVIYDLLSPGQLKHLIKKNNKYILLLDDDISRKFSSIFTIDEIFDMRAFKPWLCCFMKKIKNSDEIEKNNTSTIFFWEEKEILTVFWNDGGVPTTHSLTSENSKRFLNLWGNRENLNRNRNNNLFEQLTYLCNYTSRIDKRINELVNQSINKKQRIIEFYQWDHANIANSFEQFKKPVPIIGSSVISDHAEEMPVPLIPLGASPQYTDYRITEEKPVPALAADTLVKCMEAALIVAAVLITSSAALGIAALFLPYLLTAAIAVLGAALLAFSAYGAMRYSQSGFFSAGNKPTPRVDAIRPEVKRNRVSP